MMQKDSKLLDDLARVASGALGALSGVRNEIEGQLHQQFERILGQMDLVRREEFEAVSAMAAKARQEQEELAERVTALEALVATLTAEQELTERKHGPRRPAHPHLAQPHLVQDGAPAAGADAVDSASAGPSSAETPPDRAPGGAPPGEAGPA